MTIEIGANTTQAQQQIGQLEKAMALMERRVVTLSQANVELEKYTKTLEATQSKQRAATLSAADAQAKYAAEAMKGATAAEKLIGIETAGSRLNTLIAKQLEERNSSLAAHNASVLKGIDAAQRLIGVETSGSLLNKQIYEQMKLRLGTQEAYNASALKGAAAAERLIGIETSGLRMNTLIAQQMRDRYAEQDKLEKGKTKLSATTSKLDNVTNRYSATSKNLHGALRGTAGALDLLFLSYGAVIPLATAFAAVSTSIQIQKLGSSFEYLTQYAYSISDMTVSVQDMRKELLAMRELAQSPVELAEGLKELTKAGMDVTTALTELPTVAKFAAIAEQDLAASTEQLITLHSAFKETTTNATGGMITLADTADIVASATQGSVASFTDFQTALKYTTALASVADLSLQEVSAAAMLFADKALKGSIGTTAMRTAITKMLAPTDAVKQLMKDAGIEFNKFISGDKIMSLEKMFEELNRIRETMSREEWAKFSFKAFGLRGELAEAAFTNLPKFRENLDLLSKSAGFTAKAFSDLSETTKMQLKFLGDEIKNALIKAFDGEKATEILKGLRVIVSSPEFINGVDGLAVAFYKLAQTLVVVADAATESIGTIVDYTKGLAIAFASEDKTFTQWLTSKREGMKTWIAESESGLSQYKDQLKIVSDEIAQISKVRDLEMGDGGWTESAEKQFQALLKQKQGIEGSIEALKNKSQVTVNDTAKTGELTTATAIATKATNDHAASVDKLSEKEEKKIKVAEASHQKLISLTEEMNTFIDNSGVKTTANQLERIEKEHNAREASIKAAVGSETEKAEARLANDKSYEIKRQGVIEESEKTILAKEESFLDQLVESGNSAYDRKLAKLESAYAKEEAWIDKNVDDSLKAEELKWLNFEAYAKKKIDLQTESNAKAVSLESELQTYLAVANNDVLANKLADLDKEYNKHKAVVEAIIVTEEFSAERKKQLSSDVADWYAKEQERIQRDAWKTEKEQLLAQETMAAGFKASLLEMKNDVTSLGDLSYSTMIGVRDTFRSEVGDFLISQFGGIEGAWGSLWDNMLAKFGAVLADMVAQWAANAVFNMVFTSSGAAAGQSSTGVAAGTATSAIIDAYAESDATWFSDAWDAVETWWGSADGGYIAANPRGGRINAGTGLSDDVFLGFTNGGKTANYGMGGEYIINKKATAKNLPLLEAINSEGYATGGLYDSGVTGTMIGPKPGGGGAKSRVFEKFNELAIAMQGAGMSAEDVKDKFKDMAEATKDADSVIEKNNNGLRDNSTTTQAATTATSELSKAQDVATTASVAQKESSISLGSVLSGVATHATMTAVKMGSVALASTVLGPVLGSLAVKLGTTTTAYEEFQAVVEGFFDNTFGVDAGVVSSAISTAAEDAFGDIASMFGDATAGFGEAAEGLSDSASALSNAAEGALSSALDSSSALSNAAAGAFGETSFGAQMTQASAESLMSSASALSSSASSLGGAAASIGSWSPGMNPTNNAGGALGDPDIDSRDRTDDTTPGGLLGGGGGGGSSSSSSGGDSFSAPDPDKGNDQWASGGWLAYATGGWLGKHPNGGWINGGSGRRDDVFLGYTNGGSTANFGMGGEFVVNQRSSAKYAKELEGINNNTMNTVNQQKQPPNLTIPVYIGSELLTTLIVGVVDDQFSVRQRNPQVKGRLYAK